MPAFTALKDAANLNVPYQIMFGEPLSALLGVTITSEAGTTSTYDVVSSQQPQLTADTTGVSLTLGKGIPGVSYTIRAGVTTMAGVTLYGEATLSIIAPVSLSGDRVIALPTNPGASWDDFAWPEKQVADSLDYTLDCGAWLADAGRVLVSAAAVCPGLTVGAPNYGTTGGLNTSVVLQISAGVSGLTAMTAVALTLDNGRVLTVMVALPVGTSA